MALPHDPLWPRAQSLFSKDKSVRSDVSLFGIGAAKTSLSPTSAHQTPDAIRDALLRYSIAHSNQDVDLTKLSLSDYGDLASSDVDELETIAQVREIAQRGSFLIALGGDNSITFSAARGSEVTGLITLDAHYDLRDGISNGSPVRRLIEAGLSGKKVVQIGIADFSNSPEYAQRAKDYGITVIPVSYTHLTLPTKRIV